MKPTIIGGTKPVEPSTGIKPTVVGAKPAETPVMGEKMKPTAIKPTSITSITPIVNETPRKPTSWTSAPAPAPHVKPSALPGAQRKTMSVSIDELKSRFYTHDLETVTAARDVLSGVVLETFDAPTAISFGSSAQQKYSESVDRWLKVVKDDQVRNSGRHVQRLKEILQEVADSMMAGHSWFRRESIQSKFDRVKPEIEQLKQLLSVGEKKLAELHKELVSLKSATSLMVRESTAYMLASDYLADRLPADIARIVTDRGVSIAKTIGMLQSQALKLETDEQTITSLMASIQDGVLIALPSLWTSVATAVQDEKNDTQRFLIRDQIMDVISKLS